MADVEIETIILQGTFAARPAAADALEYYATDTDARYWSDGATWFAQPAAVETHVHAGADITSGTVADARIASTIARDSEITATKLDDFAAPDDNTDLNATTGLHGLLPKLGGGTTNFLRADGSWNAPPGGSGAELDYVQFTSNVACTATTEATANTIVTGSAIAYDGSTIVVIEFSCPTIFLPASAGVTFKLWLYDGASSIGLLAEFINPSGTSGAEWPGTGKRRLTPSAATHTYSVRGSTSTGTSTVVGNTGGAGLAMPGFIRITRA